MGVDNRCLCRLPVTDKNRPCACPLLVFRLASGGAEGRHSLTESHHDSGVCAVEGISSSTLPSVPTQDSAGRRSINWPIFIAPRNLNLSRAPELRRRISGSGEHRQGSAKTSGIWDGKFVSRLPNTSSLESRMVFENASMPSNWISIRIMLR